MTNKQIDRRIVFLGTMDPDLNLGIASLRQSLALYSLIFETPVIQDTFLLSGQCMRLEGLDPLLSTLVETGIVGVALRKGAHGVVPVARDLASRSLQGSFFPFVGDSVSTYQSMEFRAHADSLDRAITRGRKVLEWQPDKLGRLFRDKLAISAGSSEWAGDPLLLIQAYDSIEKNKHGLEAHTCSDYYKYAENLPLPEQLTIKQWARSYYLTNLPDSISISSLLPNNLLSQHRFQGESKLDWLGTESDEELAQGILNHDFLAQIPAEGIQELRKEESFAALQSAFAIGGLRENRALVEFEFGRYKKRVYERAAEFVPGFSRDSPRIIKKIGNLKKASDASGLLGSGLTSAGGLLALIFGWEAIAIGSTSGIASFVLKDRFETARKRALEEHAKVMEGARTRLRESRFRHGSLYSLLDVVHKQPEAEA